MYLSSKFIGGVMKKRIFAGILCCCIGIGAIVGCQNSDASKGIKGKRDNQEILGDYVYVPNFLTPSEKIDTVTCWGDKIYYSTINENFYVWNGKTEDEPEEIKISLQEDNDVVKTMIHPDSDGNYYVYQSLVVKVDTKENEEWHNRLIKYNSAGNEITRNEWKVDESNCIPRKILIDEDNYVYVDYTYRIDVYDTTCNFVKGITEGIAQSTEGYILGVASNGSEVFYSICDKKSAESILRNATYKESAEKKELESFLSTYYICGAPNGNFYGSAAGKVYQYDINTQEITEELVWMNCNVEEEKVEEIFALQDGRLVAYLNDYYGESNGEIVALTKMKRSEAPQKQVLTLGTFEADMALMRMVAKFNRENNEYQIEVKSYYDSYLQDGITIESKEDAYTQFHLDLVSDNCPDILNIEYSELKNYAEKELFEDLLPYLEKSDAIDIGEEFLQSYTFDGKLVALPKTVKIRTIVGSKEELGDREKWSLEEMMDYFEMHEAKDVMKADSYQLLECCMLFHMSSFVDWKHGTSDFSNQDFYRILEFCKRNGRPEGEPYHAILDNVEKQSELLYDISVDCVTDLNLLEQIYEAEGYTFIGFPTSDGSCGNVFEERGGGFGIASVSEQKQGAWEFIEMCLKEKTQFSFETTFDGLMISNENRARYFEEAVALGEDMSNGERVVMATYGDLNAYYPIAADVINIETLFASAQVPSGYDAYIMEILKEEAKDYFEDSKTVEEMAEIVDSRVEIYLRE